MIDLTQTALPITLPMTAHDTAVVLTALELLATMGAGGEVATDATVLLNKIVEANVAAVLAAAAVATQGPPPKSFGPGVMGIDYVEAEDRQRTLDGRLAQDTYAAIRIAYGPGETPICFASGDPVADWAAAQAWIAKHDAAVFLSSSCDQFVADGDRYAWDAHGDLVLAGAS